RVNHVTILGVDRRFWSPRQSVDGRGESPASDREKFWQSSDEQVILNQTLAKELGVGQGDTVTLNLQKTSALPRESVFGRRAAAEVADELRLTVREVLADQGMARF